MSRFAGAARGAKGSAMSAAGGAGAALLDTYALQKVDFIRDNWWTRPVIYGLGGHFLKRKMPEVGGGLVAIAGYMLAGYLTRGSRPKSVLVEGLTQPSEVFTAQGLTQPNEVYTAGVYDTGDAGELVQGFDMYARQNATMADASGDGDVSDAMGL